MASYYYLMASLPELSAEGAVPLTYEQFLEHCLGNVSDEVYRQLSTMMLTSGGHPLLRKWTSAYGALMGHLNDRRAARLGIPRSSDIETDIADMQTVAQAMSAQNPLEAEKLLLSHQMQLVDLLVGMHSFDEYALMGYAIKLRLLERQSCFRQQEGKNEFHKLISAIQQKVYEAQEA